MRRRRSASGVLVLVVAVALAGCTSPRNALGTGTSLCFRALAAARTAVAAKGTFAGVRDLSPGALAAVLSHSRPKTSSPLGTTRHGVCAVAYRGPFASSAVAHPWPTGRAKGAYALVVVTSTPPPERVLATVLLSQVDLRLSRP